MFGWPDEYVSQTYAKMYKYIRQREEIIQGTKVVFLDGSYDGESWVTVSILQGAEFYAQFLTAQAQVKVEEEQKVRCTERDTQFLGFARLLLSEIQSEYGGFVDVTPAMTQLETLIAQRAYDLVCHSLDYTQDDVYFEPKYVIKSVPDLTEWPVKLDEN